MNKRIVIAGAGGFGRELYGALKASPSYIAKNGIDDVVYLDDVAPHTPVRSHVISTIRDYVPQAGDRVLLAIGRPEARRNVVDSLRGRGAIFGTFLHDRAVIGAGITLGEGVIVCADVRMTTDIIVGDFVQINVNCSIGHDVIIGRYTTLSANCDLTGGVVVENYVFFGAAVSVAPNNHIGQGATVGIGSVVVRNIRPHSTVFGNPARDIGRKS